MHIPDGFIDIPTASAAAVISVGSVAVALRKSRQVLDEAVAPMAGLAAVFIFAAQMMNFPVAAGTSGHLIGGALAAILIGPWAAMLAMTVVVSTQALIFADGGLTALGLNLLNMAVVPTLLGWLLFRGLLKVLPRTHVADMAAVAVAAFITVPVAAAMFSLEFAIGGTTSLDPVLVLKTMVGIHLLIGLGEAAITVLVISAVRATRADLIVGLADRLPKLVIKETV